MFNQVQHLPPSIESHVVCNYTQNLDQFRVERIHSLDRDRWGWFWTRLCKKLNLPARLETPWLRRQVKQVAASVVHSHFGNVGASDSLLLAGLDVKHVVTFYGYDVTMLPAQDPTILETYRRMFDALDLVLCEGGFMASQIVELGCPQEKIRVHHLGVDLGQIPFEPRSWHPGEKLKILMAASFREKKGIPFAIDAIGQLAKSVDLELTIIGDANSHPSSIAEKERILAAIEAGDLASRVRLPGYLSHREMLEQAKDHHLFVSTSVTASDGDSEGGAPVSLIEMAASGMPIVSSFHCDIPEVIIDRETGWLAPEKDVNAILACLHEILEQHEQWNRFLQAGRQHVERDYCCVRQGKQLANIYRTLVNHN